MRNFCRSWEISIDTFMEEVVRVFRGGRAGIPRPLNNIRNLAPFLQSQLQIQCNGQFQWALERFCLPLTKKNRLLPWSKHAACRVDALRSRISRHVIKTALSGFFVQLNSTTRKKINNVIGNNYNKVQFVYWNLEWWNQFIFCGETWDWISNSFIVTKHSDVLVLQPFQDRKEKDSCLNPLLLSKWYFYNCGLVDKNQACSYGEK